MRNLHRKMSYRRTTILLLILAASLFSIRVSAQRSANDTILLGAFTQGADTFAMVFLNDAEVIGQFDPKFAEERARMNRLRYNVWKVYPYALIAAELIKNVDDTLDKFDSRHERKAYLKTLEKEMNKRFKGELVDMSMEQGQILVKLIDRQTGKNCFHIIKELKGGFNALIWQSVALVFNNNLKREYDPYDRDKDIETIVQEIEAYNLHRYQFEQQARQRAALQKQVQEYKTTHPVN